MAFASCPRTSDESRLIPPISQELPIGGTLRFAVGDPDGMRSSTWSVVGGKNHRDVYINARQAMGGNKLSLHKSGKWRFAENEQRDVRQDRVLIRYEPPAEVSPGWRLAVRILVPTSSLRTPFEEKPTKDRRPISWWKAPKLGWTMSFNIFLGENERSDGINVTCVGEVGRISLPEECLVWVLADEVDSSEQEDRLQELRDAAKASSKSYGSIATLAVAAWATENETGRPIIYDLGDLNAFRGF
jgi:hypothetical protein